MQYNSKAKINAPCIYAGKNKRGGRDDAYPTVNCSLNCRTCGWNPVERKRRLRQGRFETRTVIHELHDDDMVTVASRIKKDCRVLVFQKREEIASC